jgi:hypothetical protein
MTRCTGSRPEAGICVGDCARFTPFDNPDVGDNRPMAARPCR